MANTCVFCNESTDGIWCAACIELSRNERFIRLLNKLQQATTNANPHDELVMAVQQIQHVIEPITYIPVKHFNPSTQYIDKIAQTYLFKCRKTDITKAVAIITDANGNCLYNSVLSLMQLPAFSPIELRVRTIVELVINYDDYSHDYTQDVGPLQERWNNICKDYSFSDLYELAALCNVLGCNIRSLYPRIDYHSYFEIYNRTFRSRIATNNEITILWCHTMREAEARMNTKGNWLPNHFVPIVQLSGAQSVPSIQTNNGNLNTKLSNFEMFWNITVLQNGHDKFGMEEKPPGWIIPTDFNILDIRTIPADLDIANIRKIKITDGSLINCEQAIRIDNDGITHLKALDTLLSGVLSARRQSLTEDRLFSLDDEKLKELGKEYRTVFERCTVEMDPNTQNYIFNVIYSQDKDDGSTFPIIYVVEYGREVIGLCISSSSHLCNLYRELADDHPCNLASLHFKLACHYQKSAEENNNSLTLWQRACHNYYKAVKEGREDIALRYSATVGYCKCLMQIGKYNRAKKKLEKLSRLCGNNDSCIHHTGLDIEQMQRLYSFSFAQLWFLLAKAQRKTGHNDEAKESIKRCFEFKRDYKDALIEQRLIEQKTDRKQRLEKEKELEKEILDEENRVVYERRRSITTNEIRRTHDRTSYNILSIDGGGFRGLIPAIWLRAIEKKTKRRCSSIFQMLAGTSTGAIIACGLSMPSKVKGTVVHYKAEDIVDLYKKHAFKIFVPATRRRLIYRWCTQSSRYSRRGRKEIFDTYFGGTLIHDSLTDLVIPAVQADHTRTHLFTRYDSRMGNTRPAPLVDILMSTTAAPTYFRPHAFDESAYIDGGVQMNNPTMAAYSEALRYGYESKDIFILSLGTGDYVHDPLRRPTANRNCCFWLWNRKIILKNLFDIAQNNVDHQMNSILGQNNYHRWQVWFEDEIPLDDYSNETIEFLEDYAYTFLEELEARDDHKRLGVILERLS